LEKLASSTRFLARIQDPSLGLSIKAAESDNFSARCGEKSAAAYPNLAEAASPSSLAGPAPQGLAVRQVGRERQFEPQQSRLRRDKNSLV